MDLYNKAGYEFCNRCFIKIWPHTNKKAILKNGLSNYFYWCPRTESNRYLMITNQLHDLHATGAP